MNLYDIVQRRDRMLHAAEGHVEATVLKLQAGTQRAVRLRGGARIRLRDAHQATCLQATPRAPGWTLHGGSLQVWMESAQGAQLLAELPNMPSPALPPQPQPPSWRARLAARIGGTASALPAAPSSSPIQPARAVRLHWPLHMPAAYDLVLTSGEHDVALAVGPLHDARRALVDTLRGDGVEVGPGDNPAVQAGPERRVRYVEKMDAAQWAATYPKAALDPDAAARWSGYVIASAEQLEGVAPQSLDFIFSSHVLEHLVNPLQVLQNWWRCLRPGGAIAAVVPDARYSFDLRQPLTDVATLLAQHAAGGHARSDAMYAQWCRHTAVDTDPARLRARDYAIHVNYFSPDSLRAMLEAFRGMVADPGGVHVEQFRNGKDFAFAMFKPA
jgi:SAM-dependent methyltransferase